MRRNHKPRVIWSIVWIIVLLFFTWWIAGDYYRPYPPPTQIPTRTVAATWTSPVHTPTERPTETQVIPPTDRPTETQAPPPTQTPTALPVITQPQATETPGPAILYETVEDKDTLCVTYFIRPWGIKKIYRCYVMVAPGQFVALPSYLQLTPTKGWYEIITYPPITTTPFVVDTFVPSPIFTP